MEIDVRRVAAQLEGLLFDLLRGNGWVSPFDTRDENVNHWPEASQLLWELREAGLVEDKNALGLPPKWQQETFVARFKVAEVLQWELHGSSLYDELVDAASNHADCPRRIQQSDWTEWVTVEGDEFVVTIAEGEPNGSLCPRCHDYWNALDVKGVWYVYCPNCGPVTELAQVVPINGQSVVLGLPPKQGE